MRSDDFFRVDDPFGLEGGQRHVDLDLLRRLRAGPIPKADDVEVAVPLARLVHDELEVYGTSGGPELREEEMRDALLALRAVVDRVGITGFEVPFRNYSTFRNYWMRRGASGSWQARRDLLAEIFDSLHDQLADMESRALSSTLAEPISPRGRTGWARIDAEIAELRRHFQSAHSPQDYRNVGNDCVNVLEALSAEVYDAERHLREGEEEPSIKSTKKRLERFVEDAIPGSDAAASRKLLRASIDLAQEVKHSDTPTRREAGFAADSVILVANLLRRLHQPD
jgi:hypothetical protein